MLLKSVKDGLVFDLMFLNLKFFTDEIAIVFGGAEDLAIVCKLNDSVFKKVFMSFLGSTLPAIICLALTLNYRELKEYSITVTKLAFQLNLIRII